MPMKGPSKVHLIQRRIYFGIAKLNSGSVIYVAKTRTICVPAARDFIAFRIGMMRYAS